jgi:hypothetical protein
LHFRGLSPIHDEGWQRRLRVTRQLPGAVRAGDLIKVKELVSHGADWRSPTHEDTSLVELAEGYGRTTIADYLRELANSNAS